MRRRLRRRAAPRARTPASTPSASSCTATPSPRPSCASALAPASAQIVIDNFDEIERLGALIAEGDAADRRRAAGAHPRHARTSRGDTHEKISTGQADSKFGFAHGRGAEAIERVRGVAGPVAAGLHAHIGSQLLELDPFRRAAAAAREARRLSRSTTSAAASASPTPPSSRPARDRGLRRRTSSAPHASTARRAQGC